MVNNVDNHNQVEIREDEASKPQIWSKIVIKPSLLQRLLGQKDFMIERRLSDELLEDIISLSKTKSKFS